MATSTTATELLPSTETSPKRVILRLRVNEFEGEGRSWNDYGDAISAYLLWAGRSTNEYKYDGRGKHYAHVEPFQSAELNQRTFHVVLDMNQHLTTTELATTPHEIFRVLRNEYGDLKVHPFKNNLEAENFIRNIRNFTDIVYPWGRQKGEKLL